MGGFLPTNFFLIFLGPPGTFLSLKSLRFELNFLNDFLYFLRFLATCRSAYSVLNGLVPEYFGLNSVPLVIDPVGVDDLNGSGKLEPVF